METRVFNTNFLGDAYKVIYAYTKADVLDCLYNLSSLNNELVAIDIETFPKDRYKGHHDGALLSWKAKIRTLQLYYGKNVIILDFAYDDYLLVDSEIFKHLRMFLVNNRLVAHNALFETCHLQHLINAHGYKLQPLNIRCTMLAYRLCVNAMDPNPNAYGGSLAAVAKELLGVDLDKDEQGSDWSIKELTESQLHYCALDVIVPFKCILILSEIIDDYAMGEVFKLNVRAQEPIAQMMNFGFPIDAKEHKRQWDHWIEQKDKYRKECLFALNSHLKDISYDTLVGFLVLKITKNMVKYAEDLVKEHIKEDFATNLLQFLAFEEVLLKLSESPVATAEDKRVNRAVKRILKNIDNLLVNPDSNVQLSNWLKSKLSPQDLIKWPATESGKDLKTNAEAFEDNSHIEELSSVLNYKVYSKLCGTYGEGWNELMLHKDTYSCLPVNLHLCKTVTGRLSSSAPNLQTAPASHKNPEFRKMFTAISDEYKILCADYSQVELRVCADVSKDDVMRDAYKNDIDLHALTASRTANVSIDKVTKFQRQGAKAINFSLIYLGGVDSLITQAKNTYKVIMSVEEAENSIQVFRDTYERLREWQLETACDAENNLYVRTLLGKHRRLFQDNTYNTSVNTVIQGTSAEIMLEALYRIQIGIWDNCYDANIILTVHDEILVHSHFSIVDKVRDLVEKSMVDAYVWMFEDGSVSKLVECNIGNNWSEAK